MLTEVPPASGPEPGLRPPTVGVGDNGGTSSAVTIAVLADVAEREPAALEAVTTASTLSPKSLALSRYVDPVAPATLKPPRCH
jgi:hypothetical protein